MVLDECPALPAPTQTLARDGRAHRTMGAALPAAISRSCDRGRRQRRSRQQRRSGAVRHRAGRHFAGASRAERRADPRCRLRGLCDRRPECRRSQRRDVQRRRAHHAAPAGGPPALSHGRRHAVWTSSKASRAASTCSTACCRPAMRATASSSRSEGSINIKNARYAEDDEPADPACGCYTCRRFSRAYLRHLFLAGEITASTLNTLHNLYFYLDTMRRIREAISFGTFEKFRQMFHRSFSRRSSDSMMSRECDRRRISAGHAARPIRATRLSS